MAWFYRQAYDYWQDHPGTFAIVNPEGNPLCLGFLSKDAGIVLTICTCNLRGQERSTRHSIFVAKNRSIFASSLNHFSQVSLPK